MWTTAFLLLAPAFSASAWAGSAPPVPMPVPGPTNNESVADRTHRWRLAGPADAEGRYRVVDATENGGRTWHRILRRPSRDIVRITRTTARNGFVYVDADPAVLATSTNGSKWLPLALAMHPDSTLFGAHGDQRSSRSRRGMFRAAFPRRLAGDPDRRARRVRARCDVRNRRGLVCVLVARRWAYLARGAGALEQSA